MGLLTEYGTDAVRYWAAKGRPGVDTAFDTGQMKVGRRLSVKVLNIGRFVLGLGDVPGDAAVTEPVDRAMLAGLAAVVADATAAFDNYDYARALERTERYFWQVCDDYLELVKSRAYGEGPGAASARVALRQALSVLLRLFAPFLPYVTEEVWSWWREGSVHRAPWPAVAELETGDDPGAPRVLDAVGEVLRAVRRAKSEARLSMRGPVSRVTVTGDAVADVRLAAGDLRLAGVIEDLVLTPAEGDLAVEVVR
jgi:valyl-tRNA synthetase